MAKFIAVWRQSGGCDYTIGCGVAVHHFEADDRAAALKYIEDDLSSPDHSDEVIDSIKQIDLVEYVGDWTTAMPGVWAPRRAACKAADEQSTKEKKERAEYERLSKKFSK